MFAAAPRRGQRARDRIDRRLGDGAAMRVVPVVCVLLVAAGAAAAAWLAQRAPSPPPPPPSSPPVATTADAGDRRPAPDGVAPLAAGEVAAPVPADTPPAPREVVVGPRVVATPAGDALLARAATDRELTLAVAEVLHVGEIARAETPDGPLEHQMVQLRVLADTPDPAVRRWQVLDSPLCPALSERLHGCHTPFDALAAGQVRRFVLAKGRPDLAMLGLLTAIAGRRERWLVLAGPETERPDDPVLARVPLALQLHLGRPLANVFRGRVVAVAPARAVPRGVQDAFHHADVDVLDAAYVGVRGPLPKRVRLAPPPFVAGQEVASLETGVEYWFATDDSALWQTLRAAVPAAR